MIEAILYGGLTAGLLDILYACAAAYAARHVAPIRVFQTVAAGLLGRASYEGGVQTATLGGACHFFITLMMAAAYVAASRFLPVLIERPFVSGVLYGLALFVAMNYVVVPLSAAAPFTHRPKGWRLAGELFSHAFFVGLPIALAVRASAA